MKLFILISTTILTLITIAVCSATNIEMYTVEGWEHGVVLCEAESIVINLGHEGDTEVEELLALAKKCK